MKQTINSPIQAIITPSVPKDEERDYEIWLYVFRTIAVGKIHNIDDLVGYLTITNFNEGKSPQQAFDDLFYGCKFPTSIEVTY